MNPLKTLRFAGAVTVTVLLTACASNVPGPAPSGAPVPAETYSEPYRVAPLDTIVITHNDGQVDSLQATVDDKVEFPSGTPLKVIGKTPNEVTTKIESRDRSVKSVAISEYKGNRISVTGEVNIQTNFDLQDSPMKVLDAVASAGGFTPLADTSCVRLVRSTSGNVQIYILNMHDVQRGRNVYQDMLLEPGDRIFVPRSFL